MLLIANALIGECIFLFGIKFQMFGMILKLDPEDFP